MQCYPLLRVYAPKDHFSLNTGDKNMRHDISKKSSSGITRRQIIAASAIAILPTWARADLRLPYLPITEQVVVKPIGQLISSTIRWATSGDFVSQEA